MTAVRGIEEEVARALVAERTTRVRHPMRTHPRMAGLLRRMAERLDPQSRPVAERQRATARLVAGH